MNKLIMANKLKKLRKEKGLTQAQVAELINVSNSAYSAYETGNRVPRDDKKVALSLLFNRSVKFIFFDN